MNERDGKPRLVLLDDHEAVTRLFAYELGASGWDTATFADPREALTFMERHHVDVLVTDQRMPGMKGTEVTARLRRLGWSGTVLVVTGSPDDVNDAERKSLDILAVIEKPVGILEIKQYLSFVRPGPWRGHPSNTQPRTEEAS